MRSQHVYITYTCLNLLQLVARLETGEGEFHICSPLGIMFENRNFLPKDENKEEKLRSSVGYRHHEFKMQSVLVRIRNEFDRLRPDKGTMYKNYVSIYARLVAQTVFFLRADQHNSFDRWHS